VLLIAAIPTASVCASGDGFLDQRPRAVALAAWQNYGDALRLVACEQLAAVSATQGLDELTRLSDLAGPGARKIHVGS
jgi:hypothetical protein